MEAAGIIDRDFTVNRHRLLDIATFLDLVDRVDVDGSSLDDRRMVVFRRAVAELLTPAAGRAERILGMLADPNLAPHPDSVGETGEALESTPGGE